MKKLLLFLLCALLSTSFYAQTINIWSGNTSFCSPPSGEVYEVTGNGTIDINVYGGTIVTKNCIGNICAFGAWTNESATRISFDLAGSMNQSITLRFTVDWDNLSTQTHRIEYESTQGKKTQHIQIHDSSSSYMTGPNGFLCQSYTGGTYSIYNLRSPYTISWSGSNSSGSSLNFSNSTSWQTYVSGFSPNSLHSVNAEIRCNGVFKRMLSLTVITGASCRTYIDGGELLSDDGLEYSKDIKNYLQLESDNNFSNEKEITFNKIPYYSPLNNIKMFPNPVNKGQELNIQIPENLGIENIIITNINGEIIKNIAVNNGLETIIETNMLPIGMYFAQFKGKHMIKPKRFVITE
ncbi:MAG: T9SS type A sorting domain-containing protein [Bacteroidetes bacterium]|nr:T9SS type A sorting domain-containing protein [Bacteroidota bacterium]